ncbi:MAG TPA: DUF4388 domain-containing protein [Candidatus Polarisedimenticolia bacterium]|nr:DUF4388 domain-containing protein [Candidatus Polarisedimenticolia bacterium]
MALQGTLKDFSLADILQLIGMQKKTGVLTLKGRDETVTVSFLDGSVVAADSLPKRLEDRLGTVLVKSRQITQQQLQDALKVQKQTMKRLGSILVEQRAVSQQAIREALRIQVTQSIYRLFRWRDGAYHFAQDQKLDYDHENVEPLSAESILMEGARILDEWPMIEERIGPFTGIYRRTGAAEKALAGTDRSGPVLTGEDKIVLHEVDGIRSVQDLVESTPYSEFDTSRVLYELIGRHMIERVPAPVSGPAAPAKAAVKPAPAAAPVTVPAAAPAGVERAASREKRSALTLVVLLLAAGSIATAVHNPLNGLAVLQLGDPVSASLLRQASLSRMERIRYALQVYFLQNKGFPKDLNYLVLGGLLRSADLKDPWGSEYLYRPLAGGFELQGKDRAGVADPTLSLRSTTSMH